MTVRVAVLGRESVSSIMVLASCIPSLELEQDSLLQPDVQGECEVEMLNMGEGDVVIRKDTVLATADILRGVFQLQAKVKEEEEKWKETNMKHI